MIVKRNSVEWLIRLVPKRNSKYSEELLEFRCGIILDTKKKSFNLSSFPMYFSPVSANMKDYSICAIGPMKRDWKKKE